MSKNRTVEAEGSREEAVSHPFGSRKSGSKKPTGEGKEFPPIPTTPKESTAKRRARTTVEVPAAKSPEPPAAPKPEPRRKPAPKKDQPPSPPSGGKPADHQEEEPSLKFPFGKRPVFDESEDEYGDELDSTAAAAMFESILSRGARPLKVDEKPSIVASERKKNAHLQLALILVLGAVVTATGTIFLLSRGQTAEARPRSPLFTEVRGEADGSYLISVNKIFVGSEKTLNALQEYNLSSGAEVTLNLREMNTHFIQKEGEEKFSVMLQQGAYFIAVPSGLELDNLSWLTMHNGGKVTFLSKNGVQVLTVALHPITVSAITNEQSAKAAIASARASVKDYQILLAVAGMQAANK